MIVSELAAALEAAPHKDAQVIVRRQAGQVTTTWLPYAVTSEALLYTDDGEQELEGNRVVHIELAE